MNTSSNVISEERAALGLPLLPPELRKQDNSSYLRCFLKKTWCEHSSELRFGVEPAFRSLAPLSGCIFGIFL